MPSHEGLSRGLRLIGGGYLLSHFRSTIGVVRFNFSVRNGKRWNPHAVATLVFSQQQEFQVPALRPVSIALTLYKVKKSFDGKSNDCFLSL